MNTDLSTLVISRAFAPDGEIGAKRITRFCNYLPDYGIRPVVVTVQQRFLERLDKDFCPPDGVRIKRTTEWRSPLKAYAWLKHNLSPHRAEDDLPGPNQPAQIASSKRPRGLRRHLLSLLNLPDRYHGWYLPAVRAGSRVIEHERICAIFSSAPPFTSHLIARHLSKKYGIPWIADFRDPWVANATTEGAPRWVLAMHRKMEASCVKRADLVICNTEPLRRSFMDRYPLLEEGRFVTLTNGYDDSINAMPGTAAKQSRKLLLHLGEIYFRRRIDTFCQAVSNLVKAGKLVPDSFKVLFQGGMDAASLANGHKYAPELLKTGCIEFRPFTIGWPEAQKLLWAADVLLIFAWGQLQVPAKFFEYLKTGKPIFAVAEKGALTDLLDLTESGFWAEPDDLDGIATGLLKALQMDPTPPEEVARRWDSRFHFRSLTEKLADWLLELAAKGETATR